MRSGFPWPRSSTRVEAAFRAKGEGRTEMPPKPGVHPGGGDNFIHAMPAYIQDLQSAGVKWVSGYPENYKRGLPYITGLLILNDAETGAAAGRHGLRVDHRQAHRRRQRRRRPPAGPAGVLGHGRARLRRAGQSHAEAFKVLFPIKTIMAYDTDPAAAAATRPRSRHAWAWRSCA